MAILKSICALSLVRERVILSIMQIISEKEMHYLGGAVGAADGGVSDISTPDAGLTPREEEGK